jgi:hypothetical protein
MHVRCEKRTVTKQYHFITSQQIAKMTPTLLMAASMLNEKPRAQTPAVGDSVHCVTAGLFVPHALHFGQGELARAIAD